MVRYARSNRTTTANTTTTNTTTTATAAGAVQERAAGGLAGPGLVDGGRPKGGVYGCQNHRALTTLLRGRWKMQGYVVSDCGAVHNATQVRRPLNQPQNGGHGGVGLIQIAAPPV